MTLFFKFSLQQAEDKVEKYIETLTHKTPGPTSLPSKFFKQFKKCLKILFAKLANLAFQQGGFSKILKTAKVVLIHKKGNKANCNNYRPISLTSNMSKILEKIMHDRLH